MTTTTYAGLSTAVFRRLDRTADTTVFNDSLELAEAEINRRLALSPVRPMHTRATAALDAEYFAAPAGILDVDSFAIDNEPILATAPQSIQAMFERDDSEGQPRFYAQVGTDFRLHPSPDTSYTGALTYWAKVPALTSVATTNWLSLAHSDVYLHGIMAYAMMDFIYPKDDIDARMDLFDAALQRVLDAYPKRTNKAPRVVDAALSYTNRTYPIIQ